MAQPGDTSTHRKPGGWLSSRDTGGFLAICSMWGIAINITVLLCRGCCTDMIMLHKLHLGTLRAFVLMVHLSLQHKAGSDYAWPLPKQLCPIWISLDVLFSTASIMHLCAISLDRYVAIRNPIEHSRFNSRTKAIIKIAAVWTISIGISMPIPVIGLQDDSRVFVNGTCVLNDENFVLIGSFMAFFIPLIIMVITYCLTVQVLQRQATVFMCGEVPKQRRSSVNCLKKENNTENISMLHNHEGASHLNSPVNKEAVLFRKGTMQSINNERRASKVLGIVFFLFLIMWCPFFITNVMSVLCKEACDKDLLSELLDVFVWVGYVCSGVNPLVYTLFNKTYRRAFSNYIRCQYRPGKKSALRQNQCLNVASTALYSKDLTLTSYRNGNEFNSMELDEAEEGLEMQPGTSEISINSCNVITISFGIEQAVLSVASTAFTVCWRTRGFGLSEEERSGFGRAQISALLTPHI
ncbi:hypothetical protein DV515_00010858 [Chloebia gouldiae]|uniref:G-protein coupled receptors family 1 profile domain-containing protein n=1 Tax=Chloebia gouldiae TaxID=44316 RepID=A0A3L8S922_CHLGU|nr:hypothetical protein DV515_00010858 [Chloebia gouldiae]